MVNYKSLFIIALLSMVVLAFYIFKNNNDNQAVETEAAEADLINKKITRIAVCPTYYELAKKLDPQKYRIIPASSTGESVLLVSVGQADAVLAGRTLKPHELNMEAKIIDRGYSFISNQERSVSIRELKNQVVYTDLEVEELRSAFSLERIEKVDDVYRYIESGIAVTSWENTHYEKAELVHVLDESGRRVELSRQPMIFCLESCDEAAQTLFGLLR